jgi:hypothetical protein
VFGDDSTIPRTFSVKAEYIDPTTLKPSKHEFMLDLNSYYNTAHMGQTTLKDVNTSLEKIAQRLSDTGQAERIEQSLRWVRRKRGRERRRVLLASFLDRMRRAARLVGGHL